MATSNSHKGQEITIMLDGLVGLDRHCPPKIKVQYINQKKTVPEILKKKKNRRLQDD